LDLWDRKRVGKRSTFVAVKQAFDELREGVDLALQIGNFSAEFADFWMRFAHVLKVSREGGGIKREATGAS
jgi:hypothetical protein